MLSYIEISRSKLLHNYELFKSHLLAHVKIVCVVKGNAYGRGISEVTEILKDRADYFGVFSISELQKVRKITDKPVLLMGFIAKDDVRKAIELDAEFSVHNIERLQLLYDLASEINRIIKVHLEIDALFGRMGITLKELPELLQKARALKNIKIVTAYARFSCVTDRKGNVHDKKQIDEYKKAVQILRDNGYSDVKTHISSTSGALIYDNHDYDFIRLGAGLYGMWTSNEIKAVSPIKNLTSVIRWVSHIAQVREFPPGYPIGYGATFITKKKTRVAVIPQGYSDGYDCKMSNTGEVLIQGKRCKVLGKVSMNIIVVDVTHLPNLKEEDEVVLLGWQGDEEITVEELSDISETIHGEITCRLNPNLPRVIVK